MSAPTADRPLLDMHPPTAPHHRKGGFRVADILNSPLSDHQDNFSHPFMPPFHLPMSEDRTLPPPVMSTHAHNGLMTPGGSSGTASSTTSGLLTPGTISASASSSNLMTMQGNVHGYHPYAQSYNVHQHHMHGGHGGMSGSGGSRRHRSSARGGYTTAPVSVATSPINSRPTSPALQPVAYVSSRKMTPYASAEGTYVGNSPYQGTQGRSSVSLSRRSAPSSPRLGHASLTNSPTSSSLSHNKHYHHPHPRIHNQRDSHLAQSVRVAFGMTPISPASTQLHPEAEGGLPMDMELDTDPSEQQLSLRPLKRTRTDDGSIPSLSALMSRSEPSSRKVSVSPRMDGDDHDGTEETVSSPGAYGLELPPLLLHDLKPSHLSSPAEAADQPPLPPPSTQSASRLPGSRINLTSLASRNTTSL